MHDPQEYDEIESNKQRQPLTLTYHSRPSDTRRNQPARPFEVGCLLLTPADIDINRENSNWIQPS